MVSMKEVRRRATRWLSASPAELETLMLQDIVYDVIGELSWISKIRLDEGLKKVGIKQLKYQTLQTLVESGSVKHRVDEFGNVEYQLPIDPSAKNRFLPVKSDKDDEIQKVIEEETVNMKGKND